MTWLFPEGGPGSRAIGEKPGGWLRLLPLLCLALVAAWAFAATFYYGRIGFMPLDSPITWDTGCVQSRREAADPGRCRGPEAAVGGGPAYGRGQA